MAILTLPNITPNNASFGLVSNTQNMRSELNGSVQTLALPGDKWAGTFTYTNKQGVEASTLRAFIASLRGRSGRFYAMPPDYYRSLQGALPLAALWASGGSITSSLPALLADTTLITADSTVTVDSTYYWLQPGHYFEVLGELKLVTASVPNPGAGTCAISFVPPLRQAVPAATPIITTAPKATCMLSDDNQAQWQLQAASSGLIYAMSIAFEEALV